MTLAAGTYTGGMTRFLNNPDVQHELGVDFVLWLPCNPIVSEFFMADWPHNFEQDLTPLLDGGLDVLMYYGDDDFSELVEAGARAGQYRRVSASFRCCRLAATH